jgi:hypothetical protein
MKILAVLANPVFRLYAVWLFADVRNNADLVSTGLGWLTM